LKLKKGKKYTITKGGHKLNGIWTFIGSKQKYQKEYYNFERDGVEKEFSRKMHVISEYKDKGNYFHIEKRRNRKW